MSICIPSIPLILTLILLTTEKLPLDLTAMGIMAALMVTSPSKFVRPISYSFILAGTCTLIGTVYQYHCE